MTKDIISKFTLEESYLKMNETFSVLIDSRSRFETGQPGGVWISMPTTKEQLHAAMESVGITADNPQDFFINGIANTEEIPFDVPLSVIQNASIDELNYLAKVLEMLRDDDRDKFVAAATLGEYAGSVKDLINLAQNISSMRNIYNNKDTFMEWYKGKENDIPKEYCVMSLPQSPNRMAPTAYVDAAPPGHEVKELQKTIEEKRAQASGADSRKSVLENLHHKQHEIKHSQKNAEQRSIEKTDRGMEL